MITDLSKNLTKGQKITFMINGGYQSGIATFITEETVKVRWIQNQLDRNGNWVKSVMHSTLERN